MEREINLRQKFRVGFWGKFIPLQGAPEIVAAAKLLAGEPDICLVLIGNGQTYQESVGLAAELSLTNLEFTGFMPVQDLPAMINGFDVCLGIFGATPKTRRVIPNKIYEALAMAKPVISAQTPAIDELLADGENILLCQTASPEDLAAKILMLKNDPVLSKKISQAGYQLYQEQCRPVVIAKKLLADLNLS